MIKATEYWTESNIEYGLNSLLITIEMFLFCFLDLWAYSWKEFISTSGAPKRQVSIFRASVDALNFFDLFIEVGRNLRWFWHAVILRKEHIRHPEDARFDIHATHEDRRDLVRQETEAVYADADGPSEHVALKSAGLTTYERTSYYNDESDDESELTPNHRYSRNIRGNRLTRPPNSYQEAPTGNPDLYRFSDQDQNMSNDARVSQYLRSTRPM